MGTEDTVRHRIRGLRAAALRERFGTEEQCRPALFAMRGKDGFRCPVCGHGGFCELRTRKVFPCNQGKKQLGCVCKVQSQSRLMPMVSMAR